MLESSRSDYLRPRDTLVEPMQEVLIASLRKTIEAGKDTKMSRATKEDFAQWSAELVLDIFQTNADIIARREGKDVQRITHIKYNDLIIPVIEVGDDKQVLFDISSNQ